MLKKITVIFVIVTIISGIVWLIIATPVRHQISIQTTGVFGILDFISEKLLTNPKKRDIIDFTY